MGRLQNCDQRGSRYQDDVGWNPIRPIIHERSGPREEHEEGNKRKHEGNTRETLNQQEIVTHMLNPRVHKRSHDPRTTKDDTKVAGLFREEVLDPQGDLPLEGS